MSRGVNKNTGGVMFTLRLLYTRLYIEFDSSLILFYCILILWLKFEM